MSKDKKKDKPLPKKAEEPKMPVAGSPPRPGQKSVQIWMDEELHKALESFCAPRRTRPKLSKTGVIETALKIYLAGQGVWTLTDDEPPRPE